LIEAFPIGWRGVDTDRRIVTHTPKGAHSWSLDEALELRSALTEAVLRALDPTPLPEAEPLPDLPPPPSRRPAPRAVNLEDLA
jgi:hypothetical protein